MTWLRLVLLTYCTQRERTALTMKKTMMEAMRTHAALASL